MGKMGLRSTCYVIMPTQTFAEALRQSRSDLGQLLAMPALWTKTQGHREAWNALDCEIQVKLLFLASLKTHFANSAEFRRLIGDPTISVASFDERWVIQAISDEEQVEEVEAGLSPDVTKSIQRTGNRAVDSWIDQMQRGVLDQCPGISES